MCVSREQATPSFPRTPTHPPTHPPIRPRQNRAASCALWNSCFWAASGQLPPHMREGTRWVPPLTRSEKKEKNFETFIARENDLYLVFPGLNNNFPERFFSHWRTCLTRKASGVRVSREQATPGFPRTPTHPPTHPSAPARIYNCTGGIHGLPLSPRIWRRTWARRSNAR